MDGIVVGELKEVKVLLPIIFSAVHEGSKAFHDGSIRALYLPVALRIVGCRVEHFCSKCGKDVFPEVGRELRTLVGEKATRKSMVAKHVLDKKARGLLGGELLRACC